MRASSPESNRAPKGGWQINPAPAPVGGEKAESGVQRGGMIRGAKTALSGRPGRRVTGVQTFAILGVSEKGDVMAIEERRDWFFPALALAISLTAFTGFAFTYLGPLAAGTYAPVSWAVHAHGIVYLAWCALLPVQATLARRAFAVHRVLGLCSLALVAAMGFFGFLVIGVKVQAALAGEGPAFWKSFGVPVAAGLVLFLGFYAAALLNRGRPEWHKRLMISAAATVIAAGTWRLWVAGFGFNDWAMPAAIATTKLFIVAGMIHDFATRRSVHPAWWVGLGVSVVVEGASLMVAGTPMEAPIAQAIASFADVFGWMY